MKHTFSIMFLAFMAIAASAAKPQKPNQITPPEYPLVTIDPYTSAWAATDNLYDGAIQHWTGKTFPLMGVVTVDGKPYRFMGVEQPKRTILASTGETGSWNARYTFTEPSGDWTSAGYDDRLWKEGPGAFGTLTNYTVKTLWDTDKIWVRRTITIPESLKGKKVYLTFSNDDGAKFFINGQLIHNTGTRCNNGRYIELTPAQLDAIKVGDNIFAAQCENTGGPCLLDLGIITEEPQAETFPVTAVQKSAHVEATQTYYDFTCGPVDLKVIFTAPLLLDNLELVSRPVNYITYKVSSNDKSIHNVQITLIASPSWALNAPEQQSVSGAYEKDGFVYLKAGSVDQKILAKKGDDVRIDWGYFYLVGKHDELSTSGKVDDGNMIMTRDLGYTKKAEGKFMIGYDDIYSIQYFGENLRPYWNRNSDKTILDEFTIADKEYTSLMERCAKFDSDLMKRATAAGGRKYAELCALAYRQSISAHKLVQAPNGDLLWLSKENNSNGSIGTVDVTYPSAPLFLLYNPALAEGLMNHIYYYSESGRWTKPFPAHDVGTYPIANGQTYGGDMPVEEAGNMLILTAAVCRYEGSAAYAQKHWKTLTTWTEYLAKFGLDPENQLCTDDFAGHFAHNTNLSIKAIMGIACYGYMAGLQGDKATADKYTQMARDMAAKWIPMAFDGDHYKLTFDKSLTWSQKYNLVWDQMLCLNIFPKDVAKTELAYYLTKQNQWGLPLDSRKAYTKSDWIMWTATMADDKATFNALIDPLYEFYDKTEDRVPMSDWIWTDKLEHRGFKARSVVGGYFIKMLKAERK